jgi:hypothetical protein
MHNIAKIYKFVRSFLFSSVNREFLIFLFFLGLSGTFWLLMTLNETYEEELAIPVRLVDVPNNVVVTQSCSDTVYVTVRDKGFTLVTYLYTNRVAPIFIDFDAYADKDAGKGSIPLADLQKMILQRLSGSSKITSVKSPSLSFFFNYGQSKRVPIRLAGDVNPGKSYYISRIKFWPSTVTIYANKALLDSVKYVYTDALYLNNVEDTVMRRVPLRPINGVKIVPSVVKIGFYVDILTEESVEVPIVAVNMPEGKVLRTFPSKVNVKFTVGASQFRNIKPEQFMVVVDYNDISAHPSDKCILRLKQHPRDVTMARLEMKQVDYLIEQQ